MGMTLEEYRNRMYEDVTLPSGLVVKMKRLNLLGLIESLTACKLSVETMGDIDTDQLVGVANELLARMTVEPHIVKVVKERKQQMGFDELDRGDYNELVRFAINEMNEIATSFRPGEPPSKKPRARKPSKSRVPATTG